MLFCKRNVYRRFTMTNLGIKIKTLSLEKGRSQKELAEFLGVSRQTLYLWIKGEREPGQEYIEKMAEYFGITPEAMCGRNDSVSLDEKSVQPFISDESTAPDDVVPIPEFRLNFSAGNGAEPTWEEINDEQKVWYSRNFFVKHRINPNHCKRATVYGDSMEPLMYDGDKILFIETPPGSPIRDGNIYVISINGALKVKRLSQKTDGTIVIKSENKESYPDEIINPEVVNLLVLGRVIEVTHQI